MQIRCNFPDISYISETQKNNFQFLIRTHLAYIANVKKSCYMRQQSHSFESARSLTSFTTEKWSNVTSVMAFRRCNVVLTL